LNDAQAANDDYRTGTLLLLMCLNQGGSIVAAAFIAKKESKEKSY
jgi:hypothetical protein